MIVGKISRMVSDPMHVAWVQWGRWHPDSLFARYHRLATTVGLKRVHLILSFDCDIPDDAKVAWDVHSRLLDMGLCPDYAVPGEVLLQGEKVYGRIRATGARFLNHGYYMHARFVEELCQFESCFFYDQLPLAKVAEDVRRGDACLREVIGESPEGFRAPHFGTFQKPRQLRFLHTLLRELGYRYSSSTVPEAAFRHGPVIRTHGLWEIPISGMATEPMSIFDTWGFFRAPNRPYTAADYGQEGEKLARRYATLPAGILNLYGDPSQIYNSPIFFATLARLAQVATPTTFHQLLDQLP
ncbi:MAG: polysaccharide deacetylase [Magnetococcales bacterium]|nr:polysaccharide deacetylase [Magnetococcales bacterium]MBF0322870.1 polysaccharide deacetylase [Magnetococcales bacterium]